MKTTKKKKTQKLLEQLKGQVCIVSICTPIKFCKHY